MVRSFIMAVCIMAISITSVSALEMPNGSQGITITAVPGTGFLNFSSKKETIYISSYAILYIQTRGDKTVLFLQMDNGTKEYTYTIPAEKILDEIAKSKQIK